MELIIWYERSCPRPNDANAIAAAIGSELLIYQNSQFPEYLYGLALSPALLAAINVISALGSDLKPSS